MKKLFLLVFITAVSQILFSQVYTGQDAARYATGAEVVRFKASSKVPVYIKFNEDKHINIDKALEYTKHFIKAEKVDFILKNIQENGKNSQTYRYIQTLGGYPIEFSAWNVHVKDGKVSALNGDVFDNPQAPTEFVLSEKAALEVALKHVGAERYMWEDEKNEIMLKKVTKDETATYYPIAEKMIVPSEVRFTDSKLRPAYKFEIYSSMPHDKKAVYVDAITGEILFDLPLIHFTDVPATAHTAYSGVQQIMTKDSGSYYVLEDHTRGNGIITLNANNYSDYTHYTSFTNATTTWNNVNVNLDQYATDAHFATTKTYDYYLNIHNRNSIDGNGRQLVSFIHFDLIGYGYPSNVNAFWNGYWMTYGDGNSSVTPLTAIDICAHEITHGLTQNTANLAYSYESGALNEAFSDIFGAAIEFYAAPTYADWTIGEKIGYTMRSLSNPKTYGNPDTYKGVYWNSGSSDNGGVHTNSGPMYYWYYLLCEGGSGENDLENTYNVTAIGRNKAEKIAFNLLTQYLTPLSGYDDAWFYGLQAAADIYGACSPEVQAVGDAFYAIGAIEEPYINVAYADFTANATQSCSAPFVVSFINAGYNGNSFLWEFGDGSTSTDRHPIHTYTQYGTYDVKLTVSGVTACGSAFELKEDYIAVDNALSCVTVMLPDNEETIESCSGIIYDTGGPDGAYYADNTSVLTIHSPGASSIVLNILELDIETGDAGYCNYDYVAFYDGNYISSYSLINSTYYCNYTGNPGIISSTGEYLTIVLYSDPYVTGNGFKIEYYCVGASMPPIPLFTVDRTSSCDGRIHFIDESNNEPTSWLWDFGDGTTSSEQNPVHQYASTGIYTIRLTAANALGEKSILKTDYITIDMPEAPLADTSITVCMGADFEINLQLDDSVYWYDDLLDTMPVHRGAYWAHAPITEDVTYYLRDLFEAEESNVGPLNNTTDGDYFGHIGSIHYLVFDAYEQFILKSVSVNAQSAGNRTIAIRDKAQNVLLQKTVYIPSGVSRVELNMEIPQGSDLQIVGMGVPNLFRSDATADINYPYVVDDVVSIKKSSAASNEYEYYYYFYDWEISTLPCKSQFTVLTVVSRDCNNITDNELFNNILIAPNPNNGQFDIIGLEDMYENKIEITDVSGKIMFRNDKFTGSTVRLTNYSDGFYFLKISNDRGQKVIKFVIRK